MDWDRLITVEQMEAATNELLETGKKVGADSWQQRVKNQTPHCGFGEAGTCCRICSMGPCRITPKAPRGICGCDITASSAATTCASPQVVLLRTPTMAVRSATRSIRQRKNGFLSGQRPRKTEENCCRMGYQFEGKDIYDLAHEVAETALLEYGKPFGVQRFLKRAPSIPRSCGMTLASSRVLLTARFRSRCT